MKHRVIVFQKYISPGPKAGSLDIQKAEKIFQQYGEVSHTESQ